MTDNTQLEITFLKQAVEKQFARRLATSADFTALSEDLEESISPSTLIKSTRMKQAAYLLVHEKVNISEVAYRVGFSTPSYFSSSFRDYFGMTPKEFVSKYVNSDDPEALDKLFKG